MVQTAAVSPKKDHGAQPSKSAQLLRNAALPTITTTAPTVLKISLMTNASLRVFHAAILVSRLARMMESTSLANQSAANSQTNSAPQLAAALNH